MIKYLSELLILGGTIFWGVTQCSLVVVYWYFGWMFCLHLEGWVADQAASRVGVTYYLLASVFGLLSNFEDSMLLWNLSEVYQTTLLRPSHHSEKP
jgi:hypothetical protein